MNAHYTLWHSYTDDHTEQLFADVISNSDHITLNTHTPTRVPTKLLLPFSLRSLTHCTTGHHGQLNLYYWTTYPSSLQSTYNMTIDCNKNRLTVTNYKKVDWTQFTKGHSPLSLRQQYPPTYTLSIEFPRYHPDGRQTQYTKL